MKTGPQMNSLLQSLQAKVETQTHATEAQTQEMLNGFEEHLTQALNAAQQKIMRDLRDLEKLTEMIHDRTATQVEEQARKIRQATAELEESRKEWRTVTWKTMLPSYLAGVLLTFWVLLMAVQLTFPEPQNTTLAPGLASFGLEGTRVSRGPGGLGQVLSLPRGVTLTDCPIPNLNGGNVCLETAATR
ncbi:hypothetical protein [Celeribacter baekdonensis]|uniref:hypothetical protein n=1 Tax=Celeribacter baekdonensis TaxID=875171 RepID=UPI0026EF1C1B|nr:hypothetical protein [Celeribacter baekdonensis]|tara:strand:- start:517 stop:1080 length:564 start_codon:yes stop_codon:yes gene_type:complete